MSKTFPTHRLFSTYDFPLIQPGLIDSMQERSALKILSIAMICLGQGHGLFHKNAYTHILFFIATAYFQKLLG